MIPTIKCLYQTESIAKQLASFFPKYTWLPIPLSSNWKNPNKQPPDLYIIEHNSKDSISSTLTELEDYLETSKFCVITSETSLEPRLGWLEKGVDECIVKPYSLGECKVRLHRLLKYQKTASLSFLKAGELVFQPQQGAVFWQGIKKQLRSKESQILTYFFRYKNRVVTKDQLINGVWQEYDDTPTYSTIDVYIRRLRMNLGYPGKQLQTVRGFGYVLRDG